MLIAASCLPPMVVTGLFFHQETLFKLHGWPIAMAATGFSVYAITKAFSSLGIGPLVDKTGPLVPFMSIIGLLGIGTLFAGIGSSQVMGYLYFAFIGAALGFSSPVTNVIWPYFYGVKYIGSIKGFIATFRNGLTALGPLPIALALDAGWAMDKILLGIAIGILMMMVLPWWAWQMAKRERSALLCRPAKAAE
jgi:MFS family permease